MIHDCSRVEGARRREPPNTDSKLNMAELILNREQVRSVDHMAIEQGLPGVVLMENAGIGATNLLLEQNPTSVLILCGKGNNGGDGYVMARHLANQGVAVQIRIVANPDDIQGDAAINLKVLQNFDFDIEFITELDASECESADWIVDALLGTGIQGEVREPFPAVIEQINASPARVFSVDIPSGLDCDLGTPLGCAVRAEITVSFVGLKKGFQESQAKEFLGEVHVTGIGVPQQLLERFQ